MYMIRKFARAMHWANMLRDCERGAVSTFFAAALVPSVIAVAVAVDLGRAYLLQVGLQRAVDATALAAGSLTNNLNLTQTEREDLAARVFTANFSDNAWSGGATPHLSFTYATDNRVAISAHADLGTLFMGVAGIDSLTVDASVEVMLDSQGMELALVLDVTGSMRSNNDIAALRQAAEDLVNIVFGTTEGVQNNSVPNLFVGIVPYAVTVNVNVGRQDLTHSATTSGRVRNQPSSASTAITNPAGSYPLFSTARTGWLTTAGQAAIDSGVFPAGDPGREVWGGCVQERFAPPSTYTAASYQSESITLRDGQTFTIRYDTITDPTYTALSDAYDLSDAVPSSEATRFIPYIYPRHDLDNCYAGTCQNAGYYIHADARPRGPGGQSANENHQRGPNLGCPNLAVMPLVNDRRHLISTIRNIQPWHRGGTMTNIGLVWGWRILSPNWSNSTYWTNGVASWTHDGTTYSLPLDYTTGRQLGMRKVIVIMTDGNNEAYDYIGQQLDLNASSLANDYGGFGRPTAPTFGTTRNNLGVVMRTGSGSSGWTQTRNESRVVLDRRTAYLCDRIKALGITIYTITFGTRVSEEGRGLFYRCASSPNHYFHAPSQESLTTAFRSIGYQLTSLRMTR